MTRVLAQACLTGLFCIVFAVSVDAVTDVLSLAGIAVVSFTSGFLGSLVAQLVLRRGSRHRPASAEWNN